MPTKNSWLCSSQIGKWLKNFRIIRRFEDENYCVLLLHARNQAPLYCKVIKSKAHKWHSTTQWFEIFFMYISFFNYFRWILTRNLTGTTSIYASLLCKKVRFFTYFFPLHQDDNWRHQFLDYSMGKEKLDLRYFFHTH